MFCCLPNQLWCKETFPYQSSLPVLYLCPPQVSWTQALRTIVKNCYKQHGREDLLYAFEDQQVIPATATQHHLTTAQGIAHLVPSQTVVQTVSNPDGTVSLIQVHLVHCVFEHS